MKRPECMQRHSRLLSGAVAAFAILLSSATASHQALGQQASTGEPIAQRGQRPTREIRYGDWRKYCFKPAGVKAVCRTTISGTFETGQTAVRVDLIEREADGAARLQLFLPVGMYLQAGVKLSIDQGDPYRIPYTWCLTNACIAADAASPKMIGEMEVGKILLLEVLDSNILSISTSLPLNQFASVRQGAPAQTFDQAIDE